MISKGHGDTTIQDYCTAAVCCVPAASSAAVFAAAGGLSELCSRFRRSHFLPPRPPFLPSSFLVFPRFPRAAAAGFGAAPCFFCFFAAGAATSSVAFLSSAPPPAAPFLAVFFSFPAAAAAAPRAFGSSSPSESSPPVAIAASPPDPTLSARASSMAAAVAAWRAARAGGPGRQGESGGRQCTVRSGLSKRTISLLLERGDGLGHLGVHLRIRRRTGAAPHRFSRRDILQSPASPQDSSTMRARDHMSCSSRAGGVRAFSGERRKSERSACGSTGADARRASQRRCPPSGRQRRAITVWVFASARGRQAPRSVYGAGPARLAA